MKIVALVDRPGDIAEKYLNFVYQNKVFILQREIKVVKGKH